MEGVLVDARGVPLPGVRLGAFPARCLEASAAWECSPSASFALSFLTGHDGRFRIWTSSLVDGSGAARGVLVQPLEGSGLPAWTLERRLVGPADGPLLLVASFATLEARAVDRAGRLVPDAQVLCVEHGESVMDLQPYSKRWRSIDPERTAGHWEPIPAPSGTLRERVRPGAELALVAWSPSRGFAEQRVAAPAAGERIEVVLALPDPARSVATLVAPHDRAMDAEVLVCAPESGVPVAAHWLSRWGDETLRLELPPSPVLLRRVPLEHRRCGLEPYWLFERAPLELRANGREPGERVLAVEHPLGSTLRIHLRAAPADLPPEVLDAARGGEEQQLLLKKLNQSDSLWARVWLERGDDGARLPQRLQFLLPEAEEPRPYGMELYGGALPGLTFLCQERIPAGRHPLRVECDGFEPIELEVDFREGGEARLELDLAPTSR